MTDNDEHRSVAVIEMCRRVNRIAAAKYAEHGASLEDIAIASIYTAFDLATKLKGSPIAAVEWLRTAVDVQERDAMTRVQ
ncbi:hypothetical protein GCM10011529_30640 [Polymorphobacter glacialis]|uniref:Uncharacterized protein n=1 Tax=Sandarakinorhabdus glacialis TaxID=1614636 RepID=A0A917A179_9SPHN|nr:hypothetical protein [Polymorphobacter glacialis]GGE21889.1 hypothetical protein GCM10011529_30640 [Polymorphobacter glacialis]